MCFTGGPDRGAWGATSLSEDRSKVSNTFEDESRLVILAYTVLRSIPLVVADMTDSEIYTELAIAFQRKAAEAMGVRTERAKRDHGKPELTELPDHLVPPNKVATR